MPDPASSPSPSTRLDRNIPGAFEGETVTRRTADALTTPRPPAASPRPPSCCPRSASPPARRSSSARRSIWTPVGKPEDFPDDDYLPRVITLTQGIGEVGKTTVYMRRRNPEIDDRLHALPGTDAPVDRDLHPLHAPRLPGALDVGRASASSARATAASTTSRGEVSGGPPVRPLDHFYTRMRNGHGRGRPALLGQLASSSASRATAIRASRSTASASTSTPAASRRRRTRAMPKLPKLPKPPVPKRFQDAPARPGESDKRQAARAGQGGRDHAPRTGSTSAPRSPAASAGCSSARSRRGRTGSTRWARRRCSPSSRRRHRRLPGDVLHAVADPGLRVGTPHHQRRLPRRVRARHAQVGLVGDGDPDLPAHGAGRSSSARTSIRAS